MLWGYETLGTRVSCYDWATIKNFCGFGWRIHGFQCLSFHHFGGLKMRFQLCREILDSRTTGFKTGTPRDLVKLKIRFLKCLETLESKVSWFRCVTLLHFEGLKKRFLSCPETLGSNLCSYWLSYNIHFGDLKMWFLEGREILSSSVHGFSWKRLKHFGDLKSDYSRIMRLNPHSIHKASLRNFGFMKLINSKVMKPFAEEDGVRWAIFHHLGDLKKRFLQGTDSMLSSTWLFGNMNMWFLKDHENLGQRLSLSFCSAIRRTAFAFR